MNLFLSFSLSLKKSTHKKKLKNSLSLFYPELTLEPHLSFITPYSSFAWNSTGKKCICPSGLVCDSLKYTSTGNDLEGKNSQLMKES